MTRVLLVAPGRGAYGPSEHGAAERYASSPLLAEADRRRAAAGRPTVSALLGAPAFDEALHLDPVNASVLVYTLSAIEGAALRGPDLRIAAVCGNSLGWYTALHLAGALPFADGLRLVETMARLSSAGDGTGQIVYPLADDGWRPDPARREAVEAAIRAAQDGGGFAAWSVDLGGYAVLGADAEGLALLRAALPPVESGGRRYPIALPGHRAFHTELAAPRSPAAREELADLAFGMPEVPLIDGRGAQHRPLTASPAELRDYTLGAQVASPFDLAAAVRVGLREYAPDEVVLLGPGTSIAGALGMTIVREGWRGIRSKADLREAGLLRTGLY